MLLFEIIVIKSSQIFIHWFVRLHDDVVSISLYVDNTQCLILRGIKQGFEKGGGRNGYNLGEFGKLVVAVKGTGPF